MYSGLLVAVRSPRSRVCFASRRSQEKVKQPKSGRGSEPHRKSQPSQSGFPKTPPQTTSARTSATTTAAARQHTKVAHTDPLSPTHNAHQIPHVGHDGLLALQPQIRQNSPQLPRAAAAHRAQDHDDRREGPQPGAKSLACDFGSEIQYVCVKDLVSGSKKGWPLF